MKKIVFATIPMQRIKPAVYKSAENKAIEYGKPVRFPINALLAKTMKKGEQIKVVQILTDGIFTNENAEEQKRELDEINSGIGAELTYVKVIEAYEETSPVLQSRFRQLISVLDNDCEIYADITYGPKTLTPIIFYALGFAEHFFNADIKNIVYGKILFNENKQAETGTAELFDVSSLFYLNSLTSVMSAKDGKSALKILDDFFAL